MTPDSLPRRAVVVEDDQDIRGLLVKILTLQGFEVTEADTGRAGVEAVRLGGADLVTLDLNLPDIDGFEVCRQLRTFSDAYVLMLTARAEEIDRLTGLDSGADDYVSKPFSPREIQARITAMFRRPRTPAVPDEAAAGELERAVEVQRSLLPRDTIQLPDYEIAGRFQPSRSVGGDLFDWYPSDDGLHLTVADVMGKGMGAALIAATVRAVMRSIGRRADLDSAFRAASLVLEGDLEQSGSFVTLFHGRLDAATGILSYVDAGHGLALHVRSDGTAVRLDSAGPPVGASPGHLWPVSSVQLLPGDAVAVVSDGLLDVFETLEDLVAAVTREMSTGDTIEAASERLLALASPDAVSDDVTVVAVRRRAELPL